MQLQTNKLYSRGLPSAKPRPTFRPRKHVSVQTGPIQEPQSRPLTRTKGKIFINNRYKHHPVQHQFCRLFRRILAPPANRPIASQEKAQKHYRVVPVGKRLINDHNQFPLSGLSVSRVYSEAQVTPIPRVPALLTLVVGS